MTFVELVKVISRRNNVSYATTRGIIDAYNSAIVSALMEDGKTFAIPGLGRLSVKVRGERNGVNPRTGEKVVIPERKTVSFTCSASLKDSLNSK